MKEKALNKRWKREGVRALALLCVFCAAVGDDTSARAAADGRGDVLRATLANGLQVILVQNHLAPVVATSINYLVGSVEAPAGFPGMAHAQEHMMFRGSPGLSADQLADIGTVMGGEFNANTRESLTQFLFTVPSQDLDVALHIESLRMQGVLDGQEDWDQERGAIEQEVAQDRSNPQYVLYAKLREAMFAGSPYAHDALGTRNSFEKTSARMLKAFHQAWYAPNNAVLVVVGDMDPQTTLEKIQALFGGIAARQLPARPRIQFRSPTALSIRIPTDQPVGTQMIAMRVPGFASPDFPALEVLADVLNSRRFDLYGLVPHGDALSAAFAIDPLPQAGIAYTEVTFPVGADPKTQEARVRAILSKVAQSGVPSELVEAAKVQERSQAEFEKNSIAGLASEWSDAVALYGLRSPDEDLARIEAVTVADVNRVAHRYLDLTHAVSAMMVPQGTGRPIASAGGFGGQESITLKETLPTQLPDWAMAALNRLTIEQSKARPVLSTLPNGLTLITVPEEESNTVSVYGHIRNRSEIEAPAGQQGVGHVLDQMLAYGSEQFDRLKFEAALDEIGAEEHAGTDFDVKALTPDFDRSVELLADNELHPALPPAAMTVIAKQFAQIVTARNRSPGYLVQHSLRAALFPPDDPSLREASAESIGALTLADVANYYRKVFRPDLTSIVVVGNISPERARGTIEKYFGAWTASGAKPETDLPAAPINKAGTVTVADASRAQDIVILAQNLAMARSDPDFYPLEVGNAVLGGGFYSTRLSIELRKKSGLVYSANSILQAGRTRGAYYVEYACDPINVDKASNIVVQELKNIQTVPVGAAELLRVKALLLRRIPLNESSVMEIARGLLGRLELGLPPDEPTIAALRYAEVSPEQVQSAFQRWIRPADFVRVTQGPVPQ